MKHVATPVFIILCTFQSSFAFERQPTSTHEESPSALSPQHADTNAGDQSFDEDGAIDSWLDEQEELTALGRLKTFVKKYPHVSIGGAGILAAIVAAILYCRKPVDSTPPSSSGNGLSATIKPGQPFNPNNASPSEETKKSDSIFPQLETEWGHKLALDIHDGLDSGLHWAFNGGKPFKEGHGRWCELGAIRNVPKPKQWETFEMVLAKYLTKRSEKYDWIVHLTDNDNRTLPIPILLTKQSLTLKNQLESGMEKDLHRTAAPTWLVLYALALSGDAEFFNTESGNTHNLEYYKRIDHFLRWYVLSYWLFMIRNNLPSTLATIDYLDLTNERDVLDILAYIYITYNGGINCPLVSDTLEQRYDVLPHAPGIIDWKSMVEAEGIYKKFALSFVEEYELYMKVNSDESMPTFNKGNFNEKGVRVAFNNEQTPADMGLLEFYVGRRCRLFMRLTNQYKQSCEALGKKPCTIDQCAHRDAIKFCDQYPYSPYNHTHPSSYSHRPLSSRWTSYQ